MKKKYTVLTISFLSAALVVLGIFAWNSHARAEKYALYLANSSQHAFDELVTAVGEMDTALQKSLYATSTGMTGAVCTELFGKAMTAQMSLGALPVSSQELEQISGFISRVGDYAFALSRAAAKGEESTDEQRQALAGLAESSQLLAQNMKSLQADMLDGVLTMDELAESEQILSMFSADKSGATVGESLRLVEQEFPEVPALIYDGPFSQHLTDSAPKMLEGREEIDENTGREIAAGFLRMGKTRVFPMGECAGEIPCLYFGAELDGDETVTLAVSRQGGQVLGMLHSRYVQTVKVEIEDALKTAGDFLKGKGYADMMQTYYMLQGGILTVNYAYEQDGVLCYPDLIKVSVAMDTGAVCGFEATGYVSHHHDRQLPQAQISQEQAAQQLSSGLSIESGRLALIPTPGGEELLCWEFLCLGQGEQKTLIYVNALSGEQEKILLLLEDENGSLTI